MYSPAFFRLGLRTVPFIQSPKKVVESAIITEAFYPGLTKYPDTNLWSSPVFPRMWVAQVCPNISSVGDCTVYSWSILERSQTMHESVQFIIRNNYCKILKLMNCDIHNHYIFISYHLLHQLCPNYVNVCFTKSLLSNSCRVLRRVMPQQDRPRHMSSAASSAGASASAASSAAGACTRIHLHWISKKNGVWNQARICASFWCIS